MKSSKSLAYLGVCLFAILSIASRELTVTLSNGVNESLGLVQLANQSEQTSLLVGSSGMFYTSMSADPASVTINGQTVNRPNIGPIQLTSGTYVKLAWNTGYIGVLAIDEEDIRSHNR